MALEPGPHPKVSDAVAQQVYREQSRLLDAFEKSASRGINFLLIWNGGGAITLLSYLGAVPEVRGDLRALTSLAIFLFGLICVGLSVAVEFFATSKHYEAFNDAAQEYYRQRIGWDELWTSGDPPKWLRVTGFAFGYLSLLLAIVGSGAGVWAVMARALGGECS
jgi:hypothetical protein